MGFTDKMCWNVANEVIQQIFWENYIPNVDTNKSWYENLNTFLVKEWKIIYDRPYDETDVRNELFDDDDYEDHAEDVSWDRFDEIIGSYLYHEYYDLDQKRKQH